MIKVLLFKNPKELENFLNAADIFGVLKILCSNDQSGSYTVIYEIDDEDEEKEQDSETKLP